MKNFKKFLEEISIKGNRGIPGEFDKKRGDKEYLNDVSRRAKERLGAPREGDRHQMMETGGRLMELLGQSQQLTRGKEKELEDLAEEIIRLNYESILYGVELDIKLVRPGKVREFMDEESGDDDEEPPQYTNLNDPEIKKEVDKAKIINNIVQGEAKNTKHMLHLPEVKEGLDRIFTGRGESDRIFRMWNEMTNLADKMDWLVPINAKAQMIEQQPEGMAGAVKVDWKPKEMKEPKEPEEYKEPTEEDEPEEYKELPDNAVIIKARGVDFPMLLHETVKGIYQLIGALNLPDEGATPEDVRKAMIVKLNTSSALDEAEEFRYGPEIAADLRDFINLNANIEKYRNLREKVFGEMARKGKAETDWFLNLMKGILSNTQEARVEIDKLIAIVMKADDEYSDALNKWEVGEVLGHESGEYEDEGGVGYADEDNKKAEVEEESSEIDYSKMRERDLVDAMNAALDEKDYKKAHYINSFMKHESKVIYSKELEIINENKNLHIK